MVRLQRSGKAVYLETSHHCIVLRKYRISQLVIDPLENTTFVDIFDYFSQQFNIVTFYIESEKLSVVLGLIYSSLNNALKDNLDEQYENHLRQIVPSTLNFQRTSGYEVDLKLLNLDANTRSQVSSYANHVAYYSFSSIEINKTHSNILKMLMEIDNLFIILSSYRIQFKAPSHHLTIAIEASHPEFIKQKNDDLITRLTQSPFLSGKLNKIKSKSIRKSPGLISLGLTIHSIPKSSILSLFKLIPEVIDIPKMAKVPRPFQLLASCPQASKQVIAVRDQIVSQGVEKLPNLEYFIENGWHIGKVSHFDHFSHIQLSNEKLEIFIIFNLQDHDLDPKDLNLGSDVIVFLICDSIDPMDSLSQKWPILSPKISETFLTTT